MPTTYTWPVSFPSTAEPDPTTELPTNESPAVAGDDCCRVNQSAIREARDQLFVDTADGVRLDYVGQNIGLARPLAGFSDTYWRYAIKEVALKYKLVPNSFRRVLEVSLGPQKAIVGALGEDVTAGVWELPLEDASKFLQVGRVILDWGTASEETIDFCFRDSLDNELCLTTELQLDHIARPFAATYLRDPASAGTTSLQVRDSSEFPTDNFPYPIIVDRGTGSEELLLVSANTVGTNTLTVNATDLAHAGAKSKFLRRELGQPSPIKATFLVLEDESTRTFPGAGFVRVASGESNEEVVEYEANDVATSTLTLRTPLQFAHVTGEGVELVSLGSTVEMASVLQEGIGWQIFETDPRKVKIFIPTAAETIRLLDGSWLHGEVLPVFATQLNGATLAGALTLTVDSTSGLPEGGLIQIGSTVMAYAGTTATVISLLQPAPGPFADNDPVTYVRQPYSGTSLEDGNFRAPTGEMQSRKFPGPYLFDPTEQNPSAISTILAEPLPAISRVLVDQGVNRTNLEVHDVSSWPAAPFDPTDVVIGKDSGFEETRTLIDRTLKKDCAATVQTLASIGATSISYTNTGASQFPESDGASPAGYRIIISQGTVDEEIVTIHTNTPGAPGTFTLIAPTVKAHSVSAPILLLNDVITVSALTEPHQGDTISPTVPGHSVAIFTAEMDVVSAANFPTSGKAIINFGKERLDCRKRITAIGGATSYTLASTVPFPTTAYPYPVLLGEGTAKEETVLVTNNNTALGILTFQAPGALNTHAVKDYVAHFCGVPEVVEYESKDGNTLVFESPVVLESLHRIGERVILSAGDSEPRTDGWSFGLKMPQTTGGRIGLLIEFVRAAGVEVEFLTDR